MNIWKYCAKHVFAHFLKESYSYTSVLTAALLFSTWSLTHCVWKSFHHRPQQRVTRSSWHKMSGLSWIHFNLRSQHFTYNRWKLISLTEINLEHSLSLNLRLLGDNNSPLLQQNKIWNNVLMIHIFYKRRAKSIGHVWKPNRPRLAKLTAHEQTCPDAIKLVKHGNGQSLFAWPLELRIPY